MLDEIVAHVLWRVGEMHSAFLGTLLMVSLVFCGIANIILCVLVFHELSWMGMCQEGGMGVPTAQPFSPALCPAGVPGNI